MEGKSSMEEISNELNVPVQSAGNINFSSFSIPGIGLEPSVVGTVASLEVDEISEPIAGNNGVFIVQVTSVEKGADENIAGEQTRLAQSLVSRATSQAIEAHQNSVEIVDKRSKFY
jgi:peptidyl-prolyl cis-trans isomerase D